jgi:hypothetical protein
LFKQESELEEKVFDLNTLNFNLSEQIKTIKKDNQLFEQNYDKNEA